MTVFFLGKRCSTDTCLHFLGNFDKPGQVAVISRGEIIPIDVRNRRIPKPLAEVINRSLADKASERYQDAEEMYAALKKVLSAY